MDYIYVYLMDVLHVWNSRIEAIDYYLMVYKFYQADLHNPKYLNIVKKLRENNNVIYSDENRNFCNITDWTNRTNKLDHGLGIHLNKSYNRDEIMVLWKEKFSVIREVAMRHKVNLRSLVPFEKFNIINYKEFYKDLFSTFGINVVNIKLTKIDDVLGKYQLVLNDNKDLFIYVGDRYDSIRKNIDSLLENKKTKENILEMEELEK